MRRSRPLLQKGGEKRFTVDAPTDIAKARNFSVPRLGRQIVSGVAHGFEGIDSEPRTGGDKCYRERNTDDAGAYRKQDPPFDCADAVEL